MVVRSVQTRNICVVATIPMPIVVFMGPHVRYLSKQYNITVVTNGSTDSLKTLLNDKASYQNLNIARKVSIISDLLALIVLWRFFRHMKFDIVQSITPKAGLLSMIASLLAGVPVRIHWFTGQVWATRKGLGRWLLKAVDRLLVTCATHLLADSFSQREFLIGEGIVRRGQLTVLGQGSVCGVDTERFRPSRESRSKIRADLEIPDTAVVALYVGRLNREKGLHELADAFLVAAQECADLYLVMVGPDEARISDFITQRLAEVSDRLHMVEITSAPEVFMAAADFFVLPSHREGFGSSVIEAAACGIPAIGSRIYGLTDAIVDKETGILVPSRNSAALAGAMIRLTKDRSMRSEMGNKARERVEREFRQEKLTAALKGFYENLLDPKSENG